MAQYQFSVRFGDGAVKPIRSVVLADDGGAWTTGRQVVGLLNARLEGNAQLASATLLVTDARGVLIWELPFSEACLCAPRTFGLLH
ncbi:hypothetical protein [Methylobacterium planeticum]|uniref:Uncharacterized protein n=1 Tax=Methylobacterium planeticum TaxID=2615211 RepID=A0A6N6MUZ4_9HYPH|nr:hypothetical protein [Methylobacterium planeticum]KAB1074426.1 hypothetical protein F6X51_08675 [Methylobacterium planeticum]